MFSQYEEELNKLSPKEKEQAVKILKEYAKDGKSPTMDNMLYEDYAEIPVDIHTFLHDRRYLGDALYDKEGKFTLYPFWEETLAKVFPTNIDTDYNNVVLTGGIGIGKSTCAVIGIIYSLYRMLCLKDPQLHYGLQNNELISFVFVNMTLREAKGVAWAKFHNYVLQSQWFLEHGEMSRSIETPTWKPYNQSIELYPASTPSMLLGRCVWTVMADEVNFDARSIDINKQKARAKKLVTEAANRLQSRFMKGVKNPTVLWLCSSKVSDQSYLDEFIREKKEIESKTTLIIDEPQWVVRPDKDSPIKFPVAVGNQFMENVLLPKNATKQDIQVYIDRGYQILMVPIGYWESFNQNLDEALRAIAGMSIGANSNFISGVRLNQCVYANVQNPFIKEVIEVGNDPNDAQQYYNFFDLNLVPKDKIEKPLYIHLDLSMTGDKTGIAGSWIIGKKAGQEGSIGSDLQFQLAFSVSIKAPKGRQISFEKTRTFIRWLRDVGFNTRVISADSFQSASTLQLLQADGFETQVISVDKVKDRQCIPYEFFRNALYEQRVVLYRTELLKNELVNLQKDNNTGKIDHPMNGCFTGDTEIKLVDGRSISFYEAVDEFNSGKTNYVYSMNLDSKKIEAKKILKAWCTMKNQPLIRLTLDNGEQIKCTPNHRFMLRDGQYCEAQNLVCGDSLMPLYTKISQKIVSIEFIQERADVYDIEVEDNHNFALSAGVFVHNSKDQADAVAASIYSASQHGAEYAFNFGETLDTVIDISKTEDTLEQSLRELPISAIIGDVEKNYFRDFGSGLPQEPDYSYLLASEGILCI